MTMNQRSGTTIHEIAHEIYRVSTPVMAAPGSFTFNQHLVVDDEPLLFHTGPRGLFPQTREAIERVIPVTRIRHIGFSHDKFPPKGVEVVSWYIMMGIGPVVTVRLPAEQLRAVNRAIEESAWGAYRTEFYATYDYKPIWETARPTR